MAEAQSSRAKSSGKNNYNRSPSKRPAYSTARFPSRLSPTLPAELQTPLSHPYISRNPLHIFAVRRFCTKSYPRRYTSCSLLLLFYNDVTARRRVKGSKCARSVYERLDRSADNNTNDAPTVFPPAPVCTREPLLSAARGSIQDWCRERDTVSRVIR